MSVLLLTVWAFSRPVVSGPRRWSDPATWHGVVPKAGTDVTIPAGQTIWMDVSPPPLRSLQIDGTLIFADRDLALQAGYIGVSGRLEIGTATRPATHRTEITLITIPVDAQSPRLAKCLGVTGTLEMHGEPRGTGWTRLAQTAFAGTSSLSLLAAPQWRPGNTIVVASTEFDPLQSETCRITAVQGRQITLDKPLKFMHWGQITEGVDERAEVGLLSRNIVVQGDAPSETNGIGGQIMIMRGGMTHLDGVELTRMGQKGQMGRYPLHFHLAGNEAGAYVRNCSFHHCFNRCLTIHGTDNVTVSGNVAFDTIGHCYFLEDGIETGNLLENNLGLLTRRAKPDEAILPSDLTPATFWVTNPANILRGNAAAGSEGNGFWYNLPAHPTGPSRSASTDRNIWPRRLPLAGFDNNSSHSNSNDGLFVDNGPNPPGVTEAPNYTPPAPAVFEGLTAYKNRRRGVWLRGSKMEVVHARLADNSIGATFAASETLLRDSLVVGETANSHFGSPPKPWEPHCPIVGFEFYDGLVGVKNVTFVNFRPSAARQAGALTYLRYTPFFVDPRNWVAGAQFVHAVRVFLPAMRDPGPYSLSGDGYRSAVFLDSDGSVTGKAGSSVAINTAFLRDSQSHSQLSWNAGVTPAQFGRLFVDNRDLSPAPLAPVRIRREDGSKPEYQMWGSPADGGKPNVSFQTNLLAGKAYTLGYHGPPPINLRLTLRFLPAGNWVQIALPCPEGAFTVYRDHQRRMPLPEAASQAEFQAAQGSKVYRQGSILRILVKVSPGSRDETASLDIISRSLVRAGVRAAKR